MAAKIKEALGVEVELIEGTKGIFDVQVDDKLVFSAFTAGALPDEDKLVAELLATYK